MIVQSIGILQMYVSQYVIRLKNPLICRWSTELLHDMGMPYIDTQLYRF